MITPKEIWQALEEVKDPEIPVVSVVEMGIVRDVVVSEDEVVVKMTPTFAGCPALHVMERDIEERVRQLGAPAVTVETVLYPPWTSDWITDEARQKLKAFGLAPPAKHGGRLEITFYDLAACPYCNSTNTTVKNTFGPTLCRAIYYCNNCQQPFEQFKPL
ncbi:MAG: phenylacetate-CoA oxygenase subunit PaaJ [Chloroflexi bacterium]|nr:phenylacetate-CoA oxygenase subunit PaaJ [Chloroflexota bacterium]MCI0577499.1 phenylacetate-CoA oxygenase subunit PaaJ [Chloroflexota bacterium]MCI0645663.1 phenylacetate-CoA oxygenase subunit PaaJ [Chloroflexota bacterium]MCI0725575.1 phenylacetate-CoA oxygenase subunit PaaJ [Chloroflexota bacterium]